MGLWNGIGNGIGRKKSEIDFRSYWATLLFDIGYSHPMLPGLTIDKVGGVWTITSHTIDDFRKVIASPIVKYVDAVNGLDTNNGNTSGTAYKTVTKLMTGTWDRAYLAEGNYAYSDNIFVVRDHELIGTGRVTLTRGYLGNEVVWTDAGGGVYTTPLTAMQMVFENSIDDANGDPVALIKAASSALVATTPGSFYWHADEDVLYVHRSDGSSPNTSDITINYASQTVATEYSYAENIIYLGSLGGGNNTATTFRLLLKNCRKICVPGSAGGISGNVWQWLENCVFARAGVDLNNVKESGGYNPAIVEVGCLMYDAGVTYPSSTHITNTSTTHNSVITLRLNGDYSNTEGIVVHDVNAAISLNINCHAHDSVSGDATHLACFGTAAAVGETSKVYLFECTTSGTGDGVANLAPLTAHIYARDCNIHSVQAGTTLETF
jgi:hypothetical protein